MSELVTWSPDIDYDTIWFVVGQISNQISGRGISMLREKLEEEGLDLTGDLKNSLVREVRQNNSAWMTEMAMQFEAYGRFKDMKSMTYSKQAPVDAMKEFAEKIIDGKAGRDYKPFQYVSGWKPHGSFPRNRELAIRQLAWALARSRLLQPIVMRKGRGWYIRNYMKEIYGEIETNIQAAAAQATLNTIAKALKDRQ
ncbi:hypothetical protein [Dyadobacter sp. 32]|uniref:hypothetical protein n=1 Tax=Dyadobacter sp. 32 TaxID=538966 RepID=UPI0011F04D5A